MLERIGLLSTRLSHPRRLPETAHPATFQSFAKLTTHATDLSVFTILLILLILDAIVLIPVVLLQSGKGGGLAAMGGGGGGTDTLFGSRQATTILHKASWWCGGLFVAIAFALSILSSRPAGQDSILRDEFRTNAPPAPAGSAPAVPGVTTPAPSNTPAAPAPAAGQGGNDPASAGQPAPAQPQP